MSRIVAVTFISLNVFFRSLQIVDRFSGPNRRSIPPTPTQRHVSFRMPRTDTHSSVSFIQNEKGCAIFRSSVSEK
jgi:hypothetical protein